MKTDKLIVVTEEYSCVYCLKNEVNLPEEKLISLLQQTNDFKNDKILDVADGNTNHICKYCGGIANGPDEDVLCQECRMTFGHTFFSEL